MGILRVFLLLLIGFVALFVNIDLVLVFTGLIFCVFPLYIYPMMLHYKIFKEKGHGIIDYLKYLILIVMSCISLFMGGLDLVQRFKGNDD